jgi:hypothetical protein
LTAQELRKKAIDEKLEKVKKVSDLLLKANLTRQEIEKEKELKL